MEPSEFLAAAELAVAQFRFHEANDHYRRAAQAYFLVEDKAAARFALTRRARCFVQVGEYVQAQKLLDDVLEEAIAESDPRLAGLALLELGDLRSMERDAGGAREAFVSAEHHLEQAGMPQEAWCACLGKAETVIAVEGLIAFLGYFNTLVSPVRMEIPRDQIARYGALRAIALAFQGNPGEASSNGYEAVRQIIEGGQPMVAVRMLCHLSDRLFGLGQPEVGKRFRYEAVAVARHVGNTTESVRQMRDLAALVLDAAHPAQAITLLEGAVQDCEAAGRLEELEPLLRQALEIERTLDHPTLVVKRLLRLAEVTARSMGPEISAVYRVEALRIASAAGTDQRHEIAQQLTDELSTLPLGDMDDLSFVQFMRSLAFSGKFEEATQCAMSRAERFASEGDEPRAAKLAAEFAEIALLMRQTGAAESAYAMAVVLGDRCGVPEADAWHTRLEQLQDR